MMAYDQYPELIETGKSYHDPMEYETPAEKKSLKKRPRTDSVGTDHNLRTAQVQYEKNKAQALVTWQRSFIIR